MMTRRWKLLLIGFLALVVIGWVMGQYDYSRLIAGKQPVFARIQLHLRDGGSVQYLGLGYTVTAAHELRWGYEMQPDVKLSEGWKAAPYTPFRVGPELDYWTPFVSREQTRFIIETNR
jgi:hypothetical protein